MNKNLQRAKDDKNDEFYTQLKDIEDELKHYKNYFKDKVVYCNADDPRVSNFFHYFSYNFEHLGLKKLITTCYKNQELDFFSMHDKENAIALIYEGEKDNGRVPTVENIGVIKLKGDGDFRSKEAIEFLKEADIVVTNPPFSLFREYVAQLVKYEKKFIVMGNNNAITYKEIFPLIKKNKIWLGHNSNKTIEFMLSPDYDSWDRTDKKGNKYGKVPAISWYTNLDIAKRHEDLILYKQYKEENYPKYDNYDAIEVSKVSEIPLDYDGVMGVPITFLNRFNPDQFEILGINTSYSDEINHDEAKPIKKYANAKQVSKNGKVSSGNKINDSSTILNTAEPDKTYYLVEGIEGYLTITYARLFIKNRKVVK